MLPASLVMLSLVVACSSNAGSSADVSALVEKLVSPAGPPGPDITDYRGGKEDLKKLEASLKALLEGYQHPQVGKARTQLVALGTTAFPELVKHLQDKRYSCSFCYSAWVDHSVGEVVEQIMTEVVSGRFQPYGYKSRENAHGSNGQPSFRQMLKEVGAEKYAEHVKGMSRDDAEREYVEWYLKKEKAYGFTSTAQEGDIVAPCQRRLLQLASAIKPMQPAPR